MALALRGFRPVPLYDGAPGFNALIDVGPIIGALQKSAIELGNLDLRPDAPPVFLLDSRRTDFGSFVSPGKFDNRWAIFPQDFPSANFLLSRGIRSILLAQQAIAQPLPDLAHALLRWQEARLAILACGALANNPPQSFQIIRPGNFRRLWYRALVLAGSPSVRGQHARFHHDLRRCRLHVVRRLAGRAEPSPAHSLRPRPAPTPGSGRNESAVLLCRQHRDQILYQPATIATGFHYQANLIAKVDYADVLYYSAPWMLFLGLAMSGVTAYATLRLYVRR